MGQACEKPTLLWKNTSMLKRVEAFHTLTVRLLSDKITLSTLFQRCIRIVTGLWGEPPAAHSHIVGPCLGAFCHLNRPPPLDRGARQMNMSWGQKAGIRQTKNSLNGVKANFRGAPPRRGGAVHYGKAVRPMAWALETGPWRPTLFVKGGPCRGAALQDFSITLREIRFEPLAKGVRELRAWGNGGECEVIEKWLWRTRHCIRGTWPAAMGMPSRKGWKWGNDQRY